MPTDNHGLDNNYATGDSFQYNDDMDHIETRLVVRDTEANRTNYTAHSGAIFIATDTGAVYDGDGTNWNQATRAYTEVTAGGDSALREGPGTAAVAPGFNTWTTADASRPAWLELELYAETDGTSAGQVDVDVDESGGTTADYSLSTVAPAALGAGGSETQVLKIYVPAGAQYQINNVSDPNAVNAINVARQLTA